MSDIYLLSDVMSTSCYFYLTIKFNLFYKKNAWGRLEYSLNVIFKDNDAT